MKKYIFLLLASFLIFSCGQKKETDPNLISADICILGGSEAAFTAALQTARLGAQVVLISPTGHPGGMMVEGLGKDIRFGSARVIGGITRELYVNLEKRYGLEADFMTPAWHSKYEPSVAEATIEELLEKESNIQIIRKLRIKENGGVIKEGTKIKEVILENDQRISAEVFVDASIEGHLIHLAGISTETIREGKDKYGEPKNGIQHANTYRNFEVDIDPYVIEGDPSSGLLRTIQPGELGEYGAPDKHIQGFCFRMCLTNREDNLIPIAKPATYESADYELYRRYFKAGGEIFKPRHNRHNQKTDIGSWHDLSANLYGENWEYPNGNYAKQDSIVAYHKNFTLGLLWFLQNDPAVDSVNRANWAGWGLPKDEFKDNGHWPRRLYIRSARRLLSDLVITEHHTSRDNPKEEPDPVAIAWWPPDTHHARRIVRDGFVYNEGFVFGGEDWRPFGISYRALIPKRTECTNLITPTCPSSSYIAYGSIRILPTFMILGQSAGYAAYLAANDNIDIQDVDYSQLRKGLLESGQILEIPENWLEVITNNN